MMFGELRNRNKGNDKYELLRFATKLNTKIIGGASKLLSFFIKNYKPISIDTYQEIRTSLSDTFYQKLGFSKIGKTVYDYHYSDGKSLYHRALFTKKKLINEGFDSTKTEKVIMKERGFYRIESFGHYKFVWNS